MKRRAFLRSFAAILPAVPLLGLMGHWRALPTDAPAVVLNPKGWDAMGSDHYLHEFKIKTIAHWMPESVKQLENFGAIRKMIDARLRTVI